MGELSAENVTLIASTGAVVGVGARGAGISTGNAWADAAIGLIIAAIGYWLDWDGAADFIEGFGVGYFFSSVL